MATGPVIERCSVCSPFSQGRPAPDDEASTMPGKVTARTPTASIGADF